MLRAATAFSATNIDDIFILTLLFSRLDQHFRLVHVVAGQLIGFSLLVLVSLTAMLGRLLLSAPWLGLLGLLPVSLGVSALLGAWGERDAGNNQPAHTEVGFPWPERPASPMATMGQLLPAPLLAVVLLTLANGSDNIGVYLPLFARASWDEVAVTLIIFAVGLALWCLLAWQLTRVPGLADGLRRQGDWLVPLVLIGLGVAVMAENHSFEQPLSALIALLCLVMMSFTLLRRVAILDPSEPLPGLPVLRSRNRADEHHS